MTAATIVATTDVVTTGATTAVMTGTTVEVFFKIFCFEKQKDRDDLIYQNIYKVDMTTVTVEETTVTKDETMDTDAQTTESHQERKKEVRIYKPHRFSNNFSSQPFYDKLYKSRKNEIK